MAERPNPRGGKPNPGVPLRQRPDAPSPVQLTVEVVVGDITLERTPVAVIGRFEGLSLAGADRQFDRKLAGWLSKAVELKAIGSRLGELFFVPVPEGVLPARLLVIAGMGEPGRFGRDELRLLMTNVAYGVIALQHREFCTLLIGSGSGGLGGRRALAPLLEGVADALARLPSGATPDALRVTVVERDVERARQAHQLLVEVAKDFPAAAVRVVLAPQIRYQAGASSAVTSTVASPAEIDPQVTTTSITVLIPSAEEAAPGSKPSATQTFVRLQYSALGQGAVLPVREAVVQPYFTDRLPGTLARRPQEEDDHERYGQLLAAYLIPEDVRQVMFDSPALSLVVDRRTAAFPWEMAALERLREVSFLGISPGVSRQFRTLGTGGQALAPPLNNTLRVLIIADPAPGAYHLPHAGDEGLAVAKVMQRVKAFWGDRLDLQVTVRIGSRERVGQDDTRVLLVAARALGEVVESAQPCDPMEVLSLISNREYDIIHFAGHGVSQGDRSGWVMGDGCTFSAAELMRARRVPRLVFANACHSSHLGSDTRERQLSDQATLAEAFFARGVHNYIGTGWEVDDAAARQLAVAFYTHALGVVDPHAPPAVLGEALRQARKEVRRTMDSTWGAYQHYGQWNDKLLPLPNRDAWE